MSKKKVLLLGASALQLAAIRKTKELGVTCIAVDYDENAVGVKEVDKFYDISTIVMQACSRNGSKRKGGWNIYYM